MRFNFACLYTSIYLEEEMMDAIAETAYQMAIGHQEVCGVMTNEMYGRVTTKFGYAVLAGIAGMLFEAEIETDHGRGKVRYILNVDFAHKAYEAGVKRGWHAAPSSSTRHPSENAHLN